MLHFAYFLVEFRGIPPREPPISRSSSHTYMAGERPTRHCQGRICTPFPAVSLFVLLSFLLPVRALLCGRLPHTAPLVLPARPRADKNNLATLPPPHTHTAWWGSSPRHSVARPNRDLCFLDGDNEHRSVRTTRVAHRDQRTLWST